MFGRHFQRCIWQSMISTAATKNDLRERRFLRRVAQLSSAIHSEIIWEKLWSWLGRREREEHRHCTETVSCISFSGMGIPSHESNILNIFFLTRSWLAPSLDGVAKGHSWLDSGHWSSEHETKGWWVGLKPLSAGAWSAGWGKHLPYTSCYKSSSLTIGKMLIYLSAHKGRIARLESSFLEFLLNPWDFSSLDTLKLSLDVTGRERKNIVLSEGKYTFAHNGNWFLTKSEVLSDCCIQGLVISSSHTFCSK